MWNAVVGFRSSLPVEPSRPMTVESAFSGTLSEAFGDVNMGIKTTFQAAADEGCSS